ncbi:MAG: AI-2E family transporter [Alphaproteobacteria bacterium]|nr:AI-2E family transporter [Alphaproteobacteria bacterium]
MKLHLKYSIAAIVIGLLLALFLVEIKGILLPFVLAFVLAYLLNPVVGKLEGKIGRPFSSGIVVALALFLFILFILLLIPLAQAQITDFIGRVPLMAEKIWGYLKKLIVWGRPQISYQKLYQLSDSTTQTAVGILNGLGAGLNHIISGGLVIVNILALSLITPIVLFYVLKDLPQMKEKSKNLVPERFHPTFKEFLSDLNKTLSGFLRGQASVCICLAIYYGIALAFTGINLGAIVGILTGILSFIPYVGFFTGLAISALLALAGGASLTQWGALCAIFLIGNVLEGYVLTPRLVGKKVGLHPLWILFAVLAGGCLCGFLGVLVAVPVAAMIGVVLRWLNKLYQASSFYKGGK